MRMCEALAECGHEVVLFAKRGNDEDPFAHYAVARSFELELIEFRSRFSLIEYLRRFRRLAKPDLAVGRYLYPLLWLQMQGVGTIYESHAPPGRIRRMLEKRLLANNRSHGLVVITKALRKVYEQLRFVPCSDISVLPDAAVDPGVPAALPGEGASIVGFAGGWYQGRGLELMHELARRLPQLDFRLAGGTENELLSFGLPALDNVDCVGLLAPNAVAEFLANCHLLLAPYQREISVHGGDENTVQWCSPMKLFEYMAQGKAIICSDLEVFHEVLTHGENCLMVDPEDVEGWVAAIEQLVEDVELQARLAATARENFLTHFTWKLRAKRFIERAGNRDGRAEVTPA
ncbi:MAG: glycosyltransferase family 4 protein [Gammaproteobacteria bacterium]|nr:glycosyltransferase family 4 protein [Gammaproteobacteria bacterium]